MHGHSGLYRFEIGNFGFGSGKNDTRISTVAGGDWVAFISDYSIVPSSGDVQFV